MERKFTIFALFYFVFEGKFQVQAPLGAYIRGGDLTEGFLCFRFWGAYKWRGLFSEFYGILTRGKTSMDNEDGKWVSSKVRVVVLE